MLFSKSSILVLSLLLCLSLSESANAASFSGTWNFTLTATQDNCGLGLQGRTQALNGVKIKQKGSSATITAPGLPKFKARVSGNRMTGSGSVTQQGIKVSGTITATLKGAKKLSIPSTRVNLQGSGASCSISFKGNGVKAS